MLAFRGWVAVGELRGDAAREAGVAFVALGLGFEAFGWGCHFFVLFLEVGGVDGVGGWVRLRLGWVM